jgi:hypothetical protein
METGVVRPPSNTDIQKRCHLGRCAYLPARRATTGAKSSK